jgi:hypothetical protein
MHTEYFVADQARAMALAEGGPEGTDLPMLVMKWVEPWVLGTKLWGIIDDLPAPEGRLPFDLDGHNAGDEVLLAGDEEGSFGVVKIADGFVRALATLPDERITDVATRWSTAEEWIGTWEPYELDSTVEGLRDLARQVKNLDQHMYMWWSM